MGLEPEWHCFAITMILDSLNALLEKLSSGDDDAAEQVFITYEPYLRKVVRRLLPAALRAKFDSVDVVQSVWGDVLSSFRGGGTRFASAAQLRTFLIRATRNRFIDRVRQHRTAARLEQPLGETGLDALPSSPLPLASELAEAVELWERLLTLCPAEHRQILLLRRQGFTLTEIAKKVDLHEGSVRRILRNLSLRLACESTAPTEAASS
jgi:RNA polymerase sigma-70 factor (ECF subfamily)